MSRKKKQQKKGRQEAGVTPLPEIPGDFGVTMESPALRRNVEEEVLAALEDGGGEGSALIQAWHGLGAIQYRVYKDCDDHVHVEQLAEALRERLLVAMKRHLGVLPDDADPPQYSYDLSAFGSLTYSRGFGAPTRA